MFLPATTFTSDNPIQPAVFVYKNYCRPAFAQISQNAFPLGFSSLWFITVYYLPRPKLNSHSGTSISIHFFKIKKIGGVLKKQSNHQTNNQATKQKQMKTTNSHERTWRPRSTHEFQCILRCFVKSVFPHQCNLQVIWSSFVFTIVDFIFFSARALLFTAWRSEGGGSGVARTGCSLLYLRNLRGGIREFRKSLLHLLLIWATPHQGLFTLRKVPMEFWALGSQARQNRMVL